MGVDQQIKIVLFYAAVCVWFAFWVALYSVDWWVTKAVVVAYLGFMYVKARKEVKGELARQRLARLQRSEAWAHSVRTELGIG